MSTLQRSWTVWVVCSVWRRFPVTASGYGRMVSWMHSHGRLERVGVEGTGSYGAGLSRHMLRAGLVVMEVTRPNRQERHLNGKDDDLDAIEAARAVIAGRALATAKTEHRQQRGVAGVARCATLGETGADLGDGPAAPFDVHRSR